MKLYTDVDGQENNAMAPNEINSNEHSLAGTGQVCMYLIWQLVLSINTSIKLSNSFISCLKS